MQENITLKKYRLIDKDGIEYLSDKKGLFGGNKRLKIYGTLNCPSANHYISKGQYIKYRVFFQDEETAISAGYRPCAKCMKKQYSTWKASNK